MSKTSYTLIVIMLAALLYMGAARFYEVWKERSEAQKVLQANDGEPFSFQHIPVSLAGPQAEPMQDPIQYQPAYPQIYLEDTPPDPDTQHMQAQETILSIVTDFEPDLTSFNRDLQQATNGQMRDLADLSSQNLAQIVQENPQIIQLVQKHLNKKEFADKINEIFSNPQFQQSVQQLQGAPSQSAQTPMLPIRKPASSR